MTRTSLLRRALPGLLAVAALAALPGAASADGLSIGLAGCPAQTTEHPFARWLDNSNYVLAPGGTFEGSLDGWKLTGGAKVVAGSETFAAHAPGEKKALSLPSGSSATTPPICVSVLDPTMRYFAANDGGLLSLLRVEVIYHAPGGGTLNLPLGLNLLGNKNWAPSLPVLVGADLLGVLTGGKATVQFRFVPTGLGAKWRIDDVYVDPFLRG